MAENDISESMVEILWKQGIDTVGIASALRMNEAEVDKEVNRYMDRKWAEKRGSDV